MKELVNLAGVAGRSKGQQERVDEICKMFLKEGYTTSMRNMLLRAWVERGKEHGGGGGKLSADAIQRQLCLRVGRA